MGRSLDKKGGKNFVAIWPTRREKVTAEDVTFRLRRGDEVLVGVGSGAQGK